MVDNSRFRQAKVDCFWPYDPAEGHTREEIDARHLRENATVIMEALDFAYENMPEYNSDEEVDALYRAYLINSKGGDMHDAGIGIFICFIIVVILMIIFPELRHN